MRDKYRASRCLQLRQDFLRCKRRLANPLRFPRRKWCGHNEQTTCGFYASVAADRTGSLWRSRRLFARVPVAGRIVFRSSARMSASQWSGISLIAGIRLLERGIQIDKTASLCIGHSFLKRFGDPRIIIFHDELSHLRPFARGKSFKLLDDFCCTHVDEIIASGRSAQRWFRGLRFSNSSRWTLGGDGRTIDSITSLSLSLLFALCFPFVICSSIPPLTSVLLGTP